MGETYLSDSSEDESREESLTFRRSVKEIIEIKI